MQITAKKKNKIIYNSNVPYIICVFESFKSRIIRVQIDFIRRKSNTLKTILIFYTFILFPNVSTFIDLVFIEQIQNIET